MNTSDLEEAVRLAEDTERQAARDYRQELGEREADGVIEDALTPKARAWVIAYDELAAVRDALEAAMRPSER